MSVSTDYYVVKPYETANWNTLYRKEVIQAKRVGDVLEVIKPKPGNSLDKGDWPLSMRTVPASSFIQCNNASLGPLNREKYIRLVHSLEPKKFPLPYGFEAWCGKVPTKPLPKVEEEAKSATGSLQQAVNSFVGPLLVPNPSTTRQQRRPFGLVGNSDASSRSQQSGSQRQRRRHHRNQNSGGASEAQATTNRPSGASPQIWRPVTRPLQPPGTESEY